MILSLPPSTTRSIFILHFLGKRGVEGFREMKKIVFRSRKIKKGREYLELTYNESTKKSQGDDSNEMNDKQIILSQNSGKCPAPSYKLYLSKLTEIEDLFQRPNPKFKHPTDCW